METTTTTINELKENNKRMCLSALRATKNCIKCVHYDKCESRIIDIDKDRARTILLNKKAELQEQIKKTDEDLKDLLSGGSIRVEE